VQQRVSSQLVTIKEVGVVTTRHNKSCGNVPALSVVMKETIGIQPNVSAGWKRVNGFG
jgi:hypothetical protein